ncbi:MAG: ABC transporter permease [Chloroflexi bacterium]|nr:ABC transporter permease [Chloroflexota bacterium]
MQSFYQLAFRSMRTRLARTALTTTGIVLGVAVILAVAVTNDSTLTAISSLFDEASGKAQLIVQSANESGGGFDQALYARALAVPGVLAVAPSASARSVLASEAKEWQLNMTIATVGGTKDILLFGIDPAVDAQARVYTLLAGRFLRDADEQAVVLVKDFADEHRLKLNSDVPFIIPGGSETFRVVGIIKKEGAGRLNNGQMGVVGLGVLQDKFGRGRNVDALDVVAAPSIANSPDALADLKARLAERLGGSYTVIYPAARGQLISQLLATYQQGLGFFSAIALFVGAFLIYNVFNMTVVERTREIGLMRSLGASRAQVVGLMLVEALILGLAGSLLGVAAGLGIARGLTQFMAALVNLDIPQAAAPASGLAASAITGIVVTLLAALLPARSASRISPLEAMRPRAARPCSSPPPSARWSAWCGPCWRSSTAARG